METITFAYSLIPEDKGFSVQCLDWNCIFTQGDTIKECKSNAIELTEMYMELLLKGNLNKEQYPQIKKHFLEPYHFQLTFNFKTGKHINIHLHINSKIKIIRKIAATF